ncbi:putative peptidylprolyl isomerase domain and wd repeat-containing protein 1 [Monocercomonoides exilis]|uniref:putative peptidylprolyl isomerase domain and wd repeat-containing protein 1 n=1 Tax=Monocercomonoides exilis TaxID=2049356 RepID=UPI0035598E11|nr:putative peptidylprolyl isomerase domain and wd repeat-containing protein 1 [Monocercomonoides exilis]|eukprot:MONOS_4493.1-p1 / transcript=MONOS_4493.1 / gene=MONOS_4493 / organism=Monocercomonoides_exilis_PA203 / gene_product=peptidylprolyl isomerase domain and wd repeat-containing protein 1 / transcript_product=peptidylprolyl isomerase domain and wd repeat-containing protein 1 / location=Mono_scaffold00120:48212-50689(+) / protein_length=673 / sequence_SO=supercontig / SO=protein_coding / is_pseudo=false
MNKDTILTKDVDISLKQANNEKEEEESEYEEYSEYEDEEEEEEVSVNKRLRIEPEVEKAILALPSAINYELSFKHRDILSNLVLTSGHFLITASQDGFIKFWRKLPLKLEFVKTFKAHLGPITGLSCSSNGATLVSCSTDKTLKIFDVTSFDMINIIELDFVPSTCCMITKPRDAHSLVAVADSSSSFIYVYDAKGDDTPLQTFSTAHIHSVTHMCFLPSFDAVISSDTSGMLSLWDRKNPEQPVHGVKFSKVAKTDLGALAAKKSVALSLAASKDGSQFACVGSDRIVRVYDTASGKIKCEFDESIATAVELQKVAPKDSQLFIDSIEFGHRINTEKSIDRANHAASAAALAREAKSSSSTTPSDAGEEKEEKEEKEEFSTRHLGAPWNAVFDETGQILIYATCFGIKVMHIDSRRLLRLIGQHETGTRFLQVCLFQGVPSIPSTFIGTPRMLEMAKYKDIPDPCLFCTAFQKDRFYIFSNREPKEEGEVSRNVLNEKPNAEEAKAASVEEEERHLAKGAILHTTLGDITVRLFGKECPKTVENFTVHARNGYYNNLTFHRVIKGFMMQGGDPSGDGTGGTSIWGKEFEDEFHPSLKHDKPFTLSMANAGPNTNGSQFFITFVPTPWLDGKHTVFGRVVKGTEAVQLIEKVKTDRRDRPLDDIRIMSISLIS